MSKRDEVLEKLADRCISDLDHMKVDPELVRLYLQETREEAAAATTAADYDPDEDRDQEATEGHDPRCVLANAPILTQE